MRLIDVDKFEKENAMRWKINGQEDFYYSVNYLLNLAEVEAIPIEWIEEWIETSKEKIDVAHYMLSIYQMMRDWREENGNL